MSGIFEALGAALSGGRNSAKAANAFEPSSGETALILASRAREPEMVRLLLEAGADPRGVDKLGQTAMHWAAWRGQAHIIALLAAAGANPNARTRKNATPIHTAMRSHSLAAVAALPDQGPTSWRPGILAG